MGATVVLIVGTGLVIGVALRVVYEILIARIGRSRVLEIKIEEPVTEESMREQVVIPLRARLWEAAARHFYGLPPHVTVDVAATEDERVRVMTAHCRKCGVQVVYREKGNQGLDADAQAGVRAFDTFGDEPRRWIEEHQHGAPRQEN
jgi:hypothetical protein